MNVPERVKPCPFCRSENIFEAGPSGRAGVANNCESCGAIGPPVAYGETDALTDAASNAAWNRREPCPTCKDSGIVTEPTPGHCPDCEHGAIVERTIAACNSTFARRLARMIERAPRMYRPAIYEAVEGEFNES